MSRPAFHQQDGLDRRISTREHVSHYSEYSVLEKLLTEQTNPASASIDALPTADVLRIINAEDRKVAEAVEREIPAIARAVDAIVAAFQAGGRLFYIGAGTSGRLGVLDAAECPPTFSVSPDMVQGIIAGGEAGAEPRHRNHRRRSGHRRPRSSRRAASLDATVLVGIAASGRTPTCSARWPRRGAWAR